MYWQSREKRGQLTIDLVRRAEACGFRALVLTVDAPVFGLRRADIRNKFKLPSHLKLGNFEGQKSTDITIERDSSGLTDYVTKQFDGTLTWDDVKWLISITKLPVLVKGLLTAEDAIKAVEIGVQGVVVSNHGARQLDGVPASIEALPEIARAVGHKTTVIMDGGIRQGEDIFKALALGAKMVFFGRPALWGLALGGQKGVENILGILKNELDVSMAISGCRTVGDINKSCVVHESYYSKL
ncbi:peroxisomal (S)-2-hydroxy-acid oxidase GLO4-like [Ctenocephalides felis]|uniref:peroxisomal (S)-2-hydroxy-acid oxidase GLO4-like n=1 Tax=Ctenocephalides felis TaxID=7515 RepID=UPI000E6E5022|nr:peroxisomal (S)-2-hydroxy-acid oxidase GLO4-like [Ctenocephalides felis]